MGARPVGAGGTGRGGGLVGGHAISMPSSVGARPAHRRWWARALDHSCKRIVGASHSAGHAARRARTRQRIRAGRSRGEARRGRSPAEARWRRLASTQPLPMTQTSTADGFVLVDSSPGRTMTTAGSPSYVLLSTASGWRFEPARRWVALTHFEQHVVRAHRSPRPRPARRQARGWCSRRPPALSSSRCTSSSNDAAEYESSPSIAVGARRIGGALFQAVLGAFLGRCRCSATDPDARAVAARHRARRTRRGSRHRAPRWRRAARHPTRAPKRRRNAGALRAGAGGVGRPGLVSLAGPGDLLALDRGDDPGGDVGRDRHRRHAGEQRRNAGEQVVRRAALRARLQVRLGGGHVGRGHQRPHRGRRAGRSRDERRRHSWSPTSSGCVGHDVVPWCDVTGGAAVPCVGDWFVADS